MLLSQFPKLGWLNSMYQLMQKSHIAPHQTKAYTKRYHVQIRNITCSTKIFSKYNNEKEPRVASLPSQKNKKKTFADLSDMPKIRTPNIVKSIKNMIIIRWLMIPYFDETFSVKEFKIGAKTAIEVVSEYLQNKEYTALNELLDAKYLEKLKNHLNNISDEQRQMLKINAENIYFQFLSEVGVFLKSEENNDGKKTLRRWVEITYVAHASPDKPMSQMKDWDKPYEEILAEFESKGGPVILNYRFIKEFTPGKGNSSWSINAINHFRANEPN